MNTLFDKESLESAIGRLEKITADQQPLWGKMNPAQMMSHCSATMIVARDQREIKRMFLSYILGSLIKKEFYNDNPVKKNNPTHKTFIRTNDAELEKERAELIEHLRAFQAGGPEKCTAKPHAFFGNLTKEQWGMGMYKHLDHHLQQFGV